MTNDLMIAVDDLSGPEIAELLKRHLDHMFAVTPAGSVYALDLDRLRIPEITFWSARLSGTLIGCIALKDLGGGHGEIKSAHTHSDHRGRGVGRALVAHLIAEARLRAMLRLSLETGHTGHFAAPIALYRSFGFEPCGPFGDYAFDPHSLYLTRSL